MAGSTSQRLITLCAGVLLLARCSGSGCSCVQPLDGPFPEDRKNANVVQARVTPEGFAFVSQKLPDVVGSLVNTACDGVGGVRCPTGYACQCPAGQTCNTCPAANPFCANLSPKECLPSSPMPQPVIGIRVPKLGTEDGSGSQSEDYDVCNADSSLTYDNCSLYARVKNAALAPHPASTSDMDINVHLDLFTRARPNGIRLRYDCGFFCPEIRCTIYTDIQNRQVTGLMHLGHDARTDRTTIDIPSVDVPFSGDDITIEHESGDSTVGCSILGIGFVKDLIVNQVKGSLTDSVKKAITGVLEPIQTQACDPLLTTYQCPKLASQEQTVCATADKKCHFASGMQEPIPGLLGMEGKINLAASLPALLQFDGSIAFTTYAGGTRSGNLPSAYFDTGGLNMGLVGGAAATHNPCVPVRNRDTSAVPIFSFPATVAPASGGTATSYMLGTVMHERLLEELFGETYSGGLFCQELGSNKIGLINSGLIGLVLGESTTITNLNRDDAIRPVVMELHPRSVPEAHIGLGTSSPDPNNPGRTILDEPLLALVLNNLDIDMYTLVDDRYLRLITLNVDLAIGLGLEINAQNQVHLIANPVDTWIKAVHARNSDILTQTPAEIEAAVPMLLAAFLPQFAPNLDQMFNLPALQGFVLHNVRFKGIKPTGTQTPFSKPRYEFLGLFADLSFAAPGTSPERIKAQTRASLVKMVLPAPEMMATSNGAARESIKAQLKVDSIAPGSDGPLEHSYRIDGGLWHPYQQGETLWISDVEINLQGWHTVDVRSRVVDVPSTLDETGVRLQLLSDVEPPVLSAVRDGESLRVNVKDRVAVPEELVVRYRLQGGDWVTLPGGAVRTALVGADIPVDALLDVEATDVAGHTATVTLGTRPWSPAAAALARKVIKTEAAPTESGCAQTGASSGWMLLALLLGLRRRR